MDRREFLKAVGGTGAAVGGMGVVGLPVLGAPPPAPPDPTGIIPADKGISAATFAAWKQRGERRVYRGPSRHAIGMPIGGIAAGQLYLLGDGTLGGWHIDGRLNATGYGSESYKTRRPERELRQGFSITVAAAGSRPKEVPLEGEAFIGEYPVAEVRYPEPVPGLSVRLRAYSPFCPLNAKDSALPCTVMRFTIGNTSSGPVRGSIAAFLENGVELTEPGEIQPLRRNRVIAEAGLTAVLMDAVATASRAGPRPDRTLGSFEEDRYKGWTAEGEAFGAGPARGAARSQNPVTGFEGTGLVNSFVSAPTTVAGDRPTGRLTSAPFTIDRDYISFLIGGGNHRGQTCMNLLIGGKAVRTATGQADERLAPFAWDVRDLAGKSATLQIVDAASGPWGHINVDEIRLVDTLPEPLRRPRPDSLGNGTMCLSFLGEARAAAGSGGAAESAERPGPVGRIEKEFSVGAGGSVELVFVISWCFPNLHTGHGQMYANWFGDAAEVARHARDNDRRLLGQTELFRRTYYEDTTLPWWLASRLMMPTANLATGTAQWWKNGRFWGWEGVGCCHGTCTHVWNYSHAEARLFPELARSTRTMQDLGTGFEEATGRVAFRGEADKGFEYAADGQAGTVLKLYREHLCSPDDGFLKANWSKIKKCLEHLIGKDAELGGGRADGVIEGVQHNTYDINFVGANTFVGSLYLAALRAGAAMAGRVGDGDAGRYESLAESGRAWAESRLFNGEYFIQQIPRGKEKELWQYGDGCLTDQLFGQNWARCLGLPTLYDEGKVRSSLESVYRYNWAPPGGSLRQYNQKFPPEREFARDREGGLFICTWPGDARRPGQPVRYRDEVWTGCEYQAAGGMVWEGMVDEALAIVRAIDERYDGALHNPWNEVECGDHYARAMAAWGVYQALCGFHYDGPAGVIGMAPRLSPEDFAAFFTGADGWGRIVQRRIGHTQTNFVELRWGSLRLAELRAGLPPDGPKAAVARLAGREVRARIEQRGPQRAAVLAEAVVLKAGDTLEIVWT